LSFLEGAAWAVPASMPRQKAIMTRHTMMGKKALKGRIVSSFSVLILKSRSSLLILSPPI
jgi:hypothetical protein